MVEGDDVPDELLHDAAGVVAAVGFHEAEDALLFSAEDEDAVRPEEGLLVAPGKFLREVDASELSETAVRFRAAVRPVGAEVLVELNRMAVRFREAVELDTEIDREPPVRDAASTSRSPRE